MSTKNDEFGENFGVCEFLVLLFLAVAVMFGSITNASMWMSLLFSVAFFWNVGWCIFLLAHKYDREFREIYRSFNIYQKTFLWTIAGPLAWVVNGSIHLFKFLKILSVVLLSSAEIFWNWLGSLAPNDSNKKFNLEKE